MTAQDREVDGFDDALALVGGEPGAGGVPDRATGPVHGPHHSQDQGEGQERDRTRGAAPGPSAAPGHGPGSPPTARHRAERWDAARALAARSAASVPAARAASVPLDRAVGRALAEPLTALTDLPSFDTSAMDGWAVSGPGPWSVRPVKGSPRKGATGSRGADDLGILAGHGTVAPLPDGTAVRIATGARIPADTTAVVRSEHARTDSRGHLHADREVIPGQDIRPRGQECRTGDRLLPAGSLVTPAVLGLAAAAGYDELLTVPRPRVEVLVLGDELLTEGLPHDGLIRDALGPMLAPWLRTLGADVIATRRVRDDAEALCRAVTGSTADLVLTTGGTAAGPVDHVHPVLHKTGAELLVDGVAVRPGHPMLLARLASGRHLVGLPGNPLAAVSGLLTLAEPLLRTLAGRAPRPPYRAPLRDAVHGHPYDTRLVPFVHHDEGLVPLHFNGPAMLRGIAAADGLAVVPPGGARPGDELEVLDLPWAASVDGGCFT
ncbi:molybdopterin molybdotransferase MoeA [Streptomyces scopuliridis]|uniref:Molybdopterin molybdotransferase MoeA n=1 Tax=Streptomyces scopuliridis TaxID=452529 RepID=A0ACD4ZLC1_9ACTN|nr:molybdopterin molybdotransferase MoeA [Streptomyces scopuliridis]WSB98970.1 molybdopterin molybdotransferase MoeA [Streptomyces scopuliridis]WSC07328.1 molybdopterin molybdotransferase MoeA [Streptomyces scopuliridis]